MAKLAANLAMPKIDFLPGLPIPRPATAAIVANIANVSADSLAKDTAILAMGLPLLGLLMKSQITPTKLKKGTINVANIRNIVVATGDFLQRL